MNGKTIGMTTEFNYLIFSVFNICNFNLFVDTVKVIFKKQLITGKADKVEAPIFPNLVAGKIRYIQTKCFLYQIMKMDCLMYAESYKNI